MQQNKENRFSGMTREEVVLEAKKQILHSALLALAALIVIGVACYAWFASNKSVSAQVGSVSVAKDGFELASEGKAGGEKALSIVPSEYRVEGEDWGEDRGTQTSNGNRSILWRMNSASNIGNLGDRGRGISPGSRGTLEFYVIPKRNTELTLDFYLDIIPYKNGQEISPDSPVRQLMRGHLLFISAYTAGDASKKQLASLSDGHFQVTVPAGTDELQVKLNWCWPYLLSDALDYDKDIEGQMPQLIVDSLKQDTETETYPRYFFTDDVLLRYEGTASNTPGMVLITTDNIRRYARRLGDYYNDADQEIGNTVDSIVLRLRAEAT